MTAVLTPPPDSRPPVVVLSIAIAALLTTGGVLVLGRETPAAFGPSCNPAATASTPRSPIHHLFVVIKENHAFENYFGAFPGVIGNPPNGTLPLAFGSNSTLHPFALNGSSTPDLPHDHASEVIDEDNGRNDLFVAQAAASGATDPAVAVGYYGPAQLPQYYAYAHAYGLGDEFFSGYLGPTAPNRDFDLAATTDGQTSDSQPPLGTLQAPTVLNQLTSAGISWAYDYTGSRANITPLEFQDVDSNVCEARDVAPISSFPEQLGSALPPAVVFIDPSHDPLGPSGLDGFSEHPPDNVTLGADWTTAVVNAIFSSAVGPSSAVLLFYDEAGGFWDPVTPPVVNGSPDGFRVPFLVLSDYTPKGQIVSAPLDPAAVLEFIDWNWRLSPLNARVAASPGLGAFFAFSEPPRAPLFVPTPLNLTTLGNESGNSSGGVDDPPAPLRAGVSTFPVPSLSSSWSIRVPTVAFICGDARSDARRGRTGGGPGGRFIVWRSSPRCDRAGRRHPVRIRRHCADRAARTPQRARRSLLSTPP